MTEEEKHVLGELMQRVSMGDENAREMIASRYYHTIYCFIFKIIRSPEDAQDLTQETFLRLCRLDFSAKVWTNSYVYLFAIARNLCFDRFRKQRRADNVFKWEAEKAQTFIWDGPEDLDSIFQGLTGFEEKLVLLRYGKGYGIHEISQKTGIPRRTLERRFNEIKGKIRVSAEKAGM